MARGYQYKWNLLTLWIHEVMDRWWENLETSNQLNERISIQTKLPFYPFNQVYFSFFSKAAKIFERKTSGFKFQLKKGTERALKKWNALAHSHSPYTHTHSHNHAKRIRKDLLLDYSWLTLLNNFLHFSLLPQIKCRFKPPRMCQKILLWNCPMRLISSSVQRDHMHHSHPP